jgi:predicted nucleotidyltransferase component of viral defense system
MVFIINLFADHFPNHAILKGGMELRLVDCPRYTNDLDYVFVPYSSKNDIKEEVLRTLAQIPQATITGSVHSTCIRCLVEQRGIRVQVEIGVAIECKSEALSTASLAYKNSQQPRVIRVMSFDVALAHKLAAWNERGLIRDLYDAAFMINILGVKPDIDTLRERLAHIRFRQKKNKTGTSMSIQQFRTRLECEIANITQENTEMELRDYFAAEELAGLDKKIRTGLARILDFLAGSHE